MCVKKCWLGLCTPCLWLGMTLEYQLSQFVLVDGNMILISTLFHPAQMCAYFNIKASCVYIGVPFDINGEAVNWKEDKEKENKALRLLQRNTPPPSYRYQMVPSLSIWSRRVSFRYTVDKMCEGCLVGETCAEWQEGWMYCVWSGGRRWEARHCFNPCPDISAPPSVFYTGSIQPIHWCRSCDLQYIRLWEKIRE